MKLKASRIRRKLNYLPRWAWYVLSLCIGGPIGPVVVYLVFHILNNACADEQEKAFDFDWDVDIDRDGVHMRGRSGRGAQDYVDDEVYVTSDEEVERRWKQAERNARSASAKSVRNESADQAASENADVADMLREGQDALKRIRKANDMIPDPALTAQIDSIEESCRQILSTLDQRPQLLGDLRTFLRYYLPTTLKLLEARAKLERGANTKRAKEVRVRISEALGVIDKAFARQVEALDEYRFLDIESEMDVLRDMLKADGLVEEEKDPFTQGLRSDGTVSGRVDLRK